MLAKLALSLAVSALIVALGGFLAVLGRLDDLAASRQAEPAGRPPTIVPAPPAGEATPADEATGGTEEKDRSDPLEVKDPLVKLDYLIEHLDEMGQDLYDYFLDQGNDMAELRREVRYLRNTMKQVVEGLNRGPGGSARIGWGLVPKNKPLDEATARIYREEAKKFGIEVKEGEVRVRGFLNLSPNVKMPIEYFITRFPQAGHETLVHLVGNKDLETLRENPYAALKGLATALYKAMIVAGFEPGEPTHPSPDSDPRSSPRWILATGDTVYIAVRYELGGKTNVALATDWVVDPVANSVLPVDAFRFTGSARGQDPDTGDEILGAEMMGLLVSVWPNASALVEVALESSLRDDYTYNFSRIPKPEGEGPLYMDVVLSREPIEPLGDGAAPIDRPPPIGNPGPVAAPDAAPDDAR